MTPNSYYVAPPPLVTHFYPMSHRFLQAGRIWSSTRPVRTFLCRALYLTAVFLFLIVPYVLKRPLKHLLAAILHVGRLIDRVANHILTFIYNSITAIIRALAAPMLAIALLFLVLFILDPQNRQIIKDAAPTLVGLRPEADAKPLPAAALKKTPPPNPPSSKLARFHAPAQRFTSERDRVESLADALNIPPAVVTNDIDRALDLANTNARAMRPHTGRFPLPKETGDRLLAALTPADIKQLARLLEHATTINKRSFTLNATLASGDLFLDAHITSLPRSAATGACFRYAMTFMRRTFRHAMTIAACRKGGRWSFLTPTTKGQ